MSLPIQKTNIKKVFSDFLESQKLSKVSIKNYKSDLSHFKKWFIQELEAIGTSPKNLNEIIPFITSETALNYSKFLASGDSPKATVARRLSTLRRFGTFLEENEILGFNFASGVSGPIQKKFDLSSIVTSFEAHLEKEKVSKNTIKNYLSDVRQFLTWVQENAD